MIFDQLDNCELYRPVEALTKAFDFLRTLGPEAEDGEYPIRGEEIFARVMRYETRPRSEGRLESHRRYIDIQAVLSGSETVLWAPLAAIAGAPYDSESDVSFHPEPVGPLSSLQLSPDLFALFLPGDAHMPMLHPGPEPSIVTKVVVKISMDLLDYTL